LARRWPVTQAVTRCAQVRAALDDPTRTAPFRFTGGTIDKVIVDVSGERCVDHQAEVRGWLIKD